MFQKKVSKEAEVLGCMAYKAFCINLTSVNLDYWYL